MAAPREVQQRALRRAKRKKERERIMKRVRQQEKRTGEKLVGRAAPKPVQRGKFPTKPGTAAVRVKPRTPEEALTRAGKRRVEEAEKKAKTKRRKRK